MRVEVPYIPPNWFVVDVFFLDAPAKCNFFLPCTVLPQAAPTDVGGRRRSGCGTPMPQIGPRFDGVIDGLSVLGTQAFLLASAQ